MARRLVEACVPFIEVNLGGWDNHQNIFPTLRDTKLPMLDQGMSALYEDLEQRGLLQDTAIIWMGEFSRTPRINGNAGRDHWPQVFSIAMAGGGVKGGYIHGTSAPTGSTPEDDPFTVDNYAATVFSLVGIDPRKELMADGGRPIRVVNNNVIEPRILK